LYNIFVCFYKFSRATSARRDPPKSARDPPVGNRCRVYMNEISQNGDIHGAIYLLKETIQLIFFCND
jgi:hypothetical protein